MSTQGPRLRRQGITASQRPFTIRPVTSGDAGALVDLRDSVARERTSIAALPGEKSVTDENLSLAALLSTGGLSLAADVGGTLAGHAVAQRLVGRYEKHVAEVGIIIATEHRRQGLGRALMETVVDWAPAVGITKLSLAVFATNHGAIAFYRSLGFDDEGLRRKHVRMPDGDRDLRAMALLL